MTAIDWLFAGSQLMSVADCRMVSVPPLVGVAEPVPEADRSLAPQAARASVSAVAPVPARKPRRERVLEGWMGLTM